MTPVITAARDIPKFVTGWNIRPHSHVPRPHVRFGGQGQSMFKLIIAITAAAVIAAILVGITSAPPNAAANKAAALADAPVNSERISAPVMGAECSTRAWPNFDYNCQFDRRNPANEARVVRVIVF
jgi:hypothetical protein